MNSPTVAQLERDAAIVRAMCRALAMPDELVRPALRAAATADSLAERQEADVLLRLARVRLVFRAELRYGSFSAARQLRAEAQAEMHDRATSAGMGGEARRMAEAARRAAEAASACRAVHSVSARTAAHACASYMYDIHRGE